LFLSNSLQRKKYLIILKINKETLETDLKNSKSIEIKKEIHVKILKIYEKIIECMSKMFDYELAVKEW